jgi:NADH pyrophosphatase NudC (nudix superfamily)
MKKHKHIKYCSHCGKELYLHKAEKAKVYCGNVCYRKGTKGKLRGV